MPTPSVAQLLPLGRQRPRPVSADRGAPEVAGPGGASVLHLEHHPVRAPRAARLLVVAALALALAVAAAVAALAAPGSSPAGAWVLAGVHLVSLGVLARRTARPGERWIWRLALVAAVLLGVALCGSVLVAPAGTGAATPWFAPVPVLALSLGVLVLLVSQMLLLRVRLRLAGPYGWFDITAGFLASAAVAWAVFVEPLRAATGLSTTQACLALVPATGALLSFGFMITSATVSGGWVDGRVRAVVAGSVVLLAGTWGAVVLLLVDLPLTGRPPGQDAVGAGLAGALVLAVLLLALGAALPPPCAVELRDEDQRTAGIGPVVLTVESLVVLLLGQVVEVPLAAAVAAALGVVASSAKVVLLLGTLTAYHRARQEADTDELTGLGNRRVLREHLDRSVGEPTALALLDLDGFKAVNDTLGHAAGDELLRRVADRLRGAAGPRVHLVRLGGDEFALVLPGAGADAAAARAAAALAALEAPFALESGDVAVGASAGVSAAPEHGPGGGALLRRADAAMYLAKEARGGVVVHAAHPGAAVPQPRS
ncbi:diguanylate cyclase [uncultured Pseudokineococcus sp.]|uniref:GGDEF domain-containing protein n=1 Tax=uncultured Pseudokineococcus sp. TaxID=1642928 RepID=UPI00261F34AF|nr:GGDEF domain-containing protein [uncultured Pseudokineococcus sp.]